MVNSCKLSINTDEFSISANPVTVCGSVIKERNVSFILHPPILFSVSIKADFMGVLVFSLEYSSRF